MSIGYPICETTLLDDIGYPGGRLQVLEHLRDGIHDSDEPGRDGFPDKLCVRPPAELVVVHNLAIYQDDPPCFQVLNNGLVCGLDILSGVIRDFGCKATCPSTLVLTILEDVEGRARTLIVNRARR